MTRSIANRFCLVATALLLGGCVSTTPLAPVKWQLERSSPEQARAELARPMLEALQGFGNNLARIMLADYQAQGWQATSDGSAFLYRFDRRNERLPKHAYLVFRFEPGASFTTNVGEKNNIRTDKASFCLVPADEPARIKGASFDLQFTKSGFMEAFNPWCIGAAGSYPNTLLLWFKNPATKDAEMKKVASLLVAAFPQLRYQ